MSGEWSLLEQEWQPPYRPARPMDPDAAGSSRCAPHDSFRYYHEGPPRPPPQFGQQYQLPPPPPAQHTLAPPQMTLGASQYVALCQPTVSTFPRGENPREIRNKAEKQRRDKLNQTISELAALVPPVKASTRRIDKTGVLRLTAHYLRAHQYVFGDTIAHGDRGFESAMSQAILQMLNGFLLTTTYKGLVVVVSQNVQQYLGYTELDLLGQSILNITHEEDRRLLKEQLMPKSTLLGPNGELLLPEDPEDRQKVYDQLAGDKRTFVVRFKKLTQRSEPAQYVSCTVQGSLRKSDRASRGYSRCCQMVRRARARADNPCSSGNDVVFIGMVRPNSETFMSEQHIEAFRMEYRTRHSVDGEIIQCEQKISLVTGYLVHEVRGLNAMSFMHRNDVRWVIVALREMYDQQRLVGESCYRLMAKNGQFIYMRTRGYLEVEPGSRAVTTFICTNTVVDKIHGQHLIKLMKKKYTMLINNNKKPSEIQDEDSNQSNQTNEMPVEDPRQLEKVILHLVTDLPSPEPKPDPKQASSSDLPAPVHLNIIPPGKERIVNSIEKFYDVIKTFHFPHTSPAAAQNGNGSTDASEVIDLDPAENEARSPEARGFTADKDMPTTNTYEETFLKHSFEDQDDDVERFKISDQVLGAVQLKECEPTTSAMAYKRQACDQDIDENGYSFKRKVCDYEVPVFNQLEEQEKVANFEASSIDCLFDGSGLDSALNMMQTFAEPGAIQDEFPDILLDTDFQDLFENIDGNGQESAASDAKPSF